MLHGFELKTENCNEKMKLEEEISSIIKKMKDNTNKRTRQEIEALFELNEIALESYEGEQRKINKNRR